MNKLAHNEQVRFAFRPPKGEGVWYPLREEEMPADLAEMVFAARPYLRQRAEEVNEAGIINEFDAPNCFVGNAEYRLSKLPPLAKRDSPAARLSALQTCFPVDIGETRAEYDFNLSPFECPGISLPGFQITLHRLLRTSEKRSLSWSPLYVGLVPDWSLLVWFLDDAGNAVCAEERAVPQKSVARSTRIRSNNP